MLLLSASYVFYMMWKPEYALILFLITCIDFFAAKLIGKSNSEHERKSYLILSLVCNIGILFVFKYFNFIFASVEELTYAIGAHTQFPILDLILPIGLSFHTFQSISYTVDVYMRRVPPCLHFGKFALFVSFFPQLVAGPIERATGLLPQFFENRSFSLAKARSGLKHMAWGYFKKLVIADHLAPAVSAAFAHPHEFVGPSLLFATFLFSYQIYCDFSGYTDIARGAANIIGYDLRPNFDRPYASRSISEFWRRWHMSLSSWFRDYVYIPLGGNQVRPLRYMMNIMITFLLCGLWHGANWTFVIWGAINGTYLVVGHFTEMYRKKLASIMGTILSFRVMDMSKRLTTFTLISLAWIFFRSANIHDAWYILTHIFTGYNQFWINATHGALTHAVFFDNQPRQLLIGLIGILILECIEYLHATGKFSYELSHAPRAMRFVVYVFGAFAAFLMTSFFEPQQFIYLQF